MTSPPIDLPAVFPSHPELAAVALFALAVDAHLAGNEKLLRAVAYRLARLGWRVTPAGRSGGGMDQ
jgi:hypothetical protein